MSKYICIKKITRRSYLHISTCFKKSAYKIHNSSSPFHNLVWFSVLGPYDHLIITDCKLFQTINLHHLLTGQQQSFNIQKNLWTNAQIHKCKYKYEYKYRYTNTQQQQSFNIQKNLWTNDAAANFFNLAQFSVIGQDLDLIWKVNISGFRGYKFLGSIETCNQQCHT